MFQFRQVACTDFIRPQRPDDRPAAFIISFCLPDGHQKAEQTTKSQGQIYLKNGSLFEIDRKCSIMMQTVFGHPPTVTADFNSILHGRLGQSARQCGPKVRGRFAFPSVRNPRIQSVSHIRKIFPHFSSEFPGISLRNPRKDLRRWAKGGEP